MDIIDNIAKNPSHVRNAIWQQNLEDCKSKMDQINQNVSHTITGIDHKEYFSGKVCAYLAGCFFFLGYFVVKSFKSCLIGALVGVLIYALLNIWVKKYNSYADAQVKRLLRGMDKEIKKVCDEADRRAVEQIHSYDENVKQCYQVILQKDDTITSMVQHNVEVFQRVVSHAYNGSNKRFVETDFGYEVHKDGIEYKYPSLYIGFQDFFSFDKQRFNNLKWNSECEALALALAKLTMEKMMSLYPKNSISITESHIDSEVILHYKALNGNFVAARDIF